jgi:hypothetical protein
VVGHYGAHSGKAAYTLLILAAFVAAASNTLAASRSSYLVFAVSTSAWLLGTYV